MMRDLEFNLSQTLTHVLLLVYVYTFTILCLTHVSGVTTPHVCFGFSVEAESNVMLIINIGTRGVLNGNIQH